MNETRNLWLDWLERVVRVPLERAAEGRLRSSLPGKGERPHSHPLETMGRILAGIAPWLDGAGGDGRERELRAEFRQRVLEGLDKGCDPDHDDFWGFGRDQQSLVDAAFLAQGLLRAPGLMKDVGRRELLIAALSSTRSRPPSFNNWLLFSACVEAALDRLGAAPDLMRVDYALRQHEQWYLGDGVWGDGPAFHADYYNSFVIQPMMRDVLEVFDGLKPEWGSLMERCRPRFRRYAAQQERMIAADGSWPPLGRSLTYRCGAFHALAAQAWRRDLPEELTPAQVRCALAAALEKSLSAPGTFTEEGWLNIGLCGHQPSLGESYISVPSQYLACFIFPPLGLPPENPFWSDPDEPWRSSSSSASCGRASMPTTATPRSRSRRAAARPDSPRP